MHVPDTDLRLSAMRALLGNVPGSLRAFSAECSAATLRLRSIFDATATDADMELLSIAGAEIIADYPACELEEEFIRSATEDTMIHLAQLVFLRHEH